MILTVTGNVAIDRTYEVERLTVDTVHHVRRASAQTGGKGVNVARCLHRLGVEACVGGVIGRPGLTEAAAELTAAGLRSELFPVDGAARQTITVTADDGTTTAFYEPGPTVSGETWAAFDAQVGELLGGMRMLVIAGSLPPGAPARALADLCERANRAGVPVVVDARGAAMRAAQSRNPLVAKLNRDELAETLERPLEDRDAVIAGAVELRDRGARHVVVTLGSEGAIGVDDDVWTVTHPTATGNPIGAGDAFSAGLAQALTAAQPFPEALRRGAAAALASLRTPTAGALDATDVDAVLPAVTIQPTRKLSLR